VHSPAVPPVDALRSKIKQFVDTGVLAGHPNRLWVNPDCGLKTRDWVEVHSLSVSNRDLRPFIPKTHSLTHGWQAPPVCRLAPVQGCCVRGSDMRACFG